MTGPEACMGIFSWLFGKPKRVQIEDKIWLTRSAKHAGIAADLRNPLPEQQNVLLLAHFPDTLAALKGELAQFPVKLEPLGLRITTKQVLAQATRDPRAVYVGLQRHLVIEEGEVDGGDEPGLSRIIVLERHPLRSEDDTIAAFAQNLGRPVRLQFHMALDEPLMGMFAGEWVAGMLRQLGANENNVIESPLISRRIAAAQKKFARLVPDPRTADSAVEWLQRNGLAREESPERQ
jgi:hypothetical protein